MKKVKDKVEKMNLHGVDIEYSHDTITVYTKDDLSEFEFKELANRKITYMQDEAFVERKPYKVILKRYVVNK